MYVDRDFLCFWTRSLSCTLSTAGLIISLTCFLDNSACCTISTALARLTSALRRSHFLNCCLPVDQFLTNGWWPAFFAIFTQIYLHSYFRQIRVNALPVFLLNRPQSVAFINYVFAWGAESLECFQDLAKLVLITISSTLKHFVNILASLPAWLSIMPIFAKSALSLASVPAMYHFNCSSKSFQFWATLPVKDRGSGGLHKLAISPERF